MSSIKKPPVYHPQMVNGNPYDKGFRKKQPSGSYGDFRPVHVRSDGKRYPVDIVYFKTAESGGRSSILRRNLLTLDVILSGPIQIRVT